MKNLAIVTTSYRNDLSWCRILCESIDRFVPDEIIHYLFIEDGDMELFRPLLNHRRRIISQNMIIPRWMVKSPVKFIGHSFWVSPFTLPVRGWIMQQVVKLGIFEVLDEDVFLCLDSEAFFFRHFDPSVLFRNGEVILVSHEEPWDWPNAKIYYKAAARLLRIRVEDLPVRRYMSVQFVFRRDVLKRLAERVSRHAVFKNWKIPLFNKIRFSEYTLYGIFAEWVMGLSESGHFPAEEFLVRYVGPKSYSHDIVKLEKLLDNFVPAAGEVGILLQKGRAKKKGISPDASLYEEMVRRLWNRLNS